MTDGGGGGVGAGRGRGGRRSDEFMRGGGRGFRERKRSEGETRVERRSIDEPSLSVPLEDDDGMPKVIFNNYLQYLL